MSSSTTDTAPARPKRNGITQPSRRGGSGRVLTDVLVDLGFVDRGTMDLAIERGTESGAEAERVLVNDGTINADQLARAVAERFGLDHIDLDLYRVDPDAAKLVAPAAVKRYQALPVSFAGDRTLLVAMVDPANVLAIDDIAVMTGYEVRPAVASLADVERLLERLQDPNFGEGATAPEEADPDAETAGVPPREGPPGGGPTYDYRQDNATVRFGVGGEDASVIQLVHRVIKDAVERGSSDIHFEPGEEEMRIRFRIDGVLQEAATVPTSAVPAVVSRVKILSDLDIAERRIPQDGRISLEVEGKPIDLRVATLPSSFGEKVVMRILDQSKVMIELEQLGMLPQALERFTKAFGQAHGAVLVTGPTGSGKSTSLYGALNQLNTVEKNIITIEDPVEYQLGGITQVQVNNKAGLTFASGLRSMMRADPDIIMVGEIRDRETAQIAIEAALTGHLVLSHAAHQRRPGRGHATDRDGHRAVPRRLGGRLRRRPAARATAVRGVQAAHDDHRRGDARERLQRRPGAGGVRAGRLRALRRLGLQGPDRPLRGHVGERHDPVAGRRPRALRDDRPCGGARGHDAAARGRAREGPPRSHVDRRDRPRSRNPLGVPDRRTLHTFSAGRAGPL